MWSFLAARPSDKSSMRRITVFFFAITMAFFAATFTSDTPAQAQQSSSDVNLAATWSGNNLEYNGWTLMPSAGRNVPSLTGTPCDNNKNVYSSDINRSNTYPGEAVIVVICPNGDTVDKSRPMNATYLAYHAPEGTTSASKFTTHSVSVPIQIVPSGTDVDIMATWSGNNLEYYGWTLMPSAGRNVPSLDGTPCANNKNVFSSDINHSNTYPGESVILVICPNGDIGDKSQAISATYLAYHTPKKTTSVSDFTTHSVPIPVQIAPLGSDALGHSTQPPEGATSCDSTFLHGLGWIVCPITNTLADGMDWLFNILSHFLVVQPLSTDQASPLYRAWGIMRNFANVFFVIGFLIIIYSQITTLGLSSYGVKRLLPRLIIAAIVVNVSYWICAVAIDLSNILGFAFQQLFLSIRSSLDVPHVTDDSWQVVSWKSVAGYILSGGAVVGGLAVLGVAVMTGTIGAVIMLLLPILLGVLLSALVAILVLAARQALITILIIVSPLAAVAYLLPNTEKYFERWRELFGTMLLVFPIFSVVFGGSQLAGTAIILNAPKDNGNQLPIILLGMAVQVAPLAITPMLIKISGNLLGRFAGIVNNPNKGLIDRSRNFTNERYAQAKARKKGEGYVDENGNFRYRYNNPALRLARRFDRNKRTRAGYQKAYEENLEADWANTADAHGIYAASQTAHRNKAKAESEAEALYNEAIRSRDSLRRLDTQMRVNQQEAAYRKTVNDNAYERIKADPTVDAALGDMAIRAQELTNLEKTQANRLNTAKRVQDSNYVGEMIRNAALQAEAGDSRIDEFGAQRVKTAAQAQQSQAYQERIKNYRTSFGFENIKENDALQLALGHDAADYTVNDELREAAVEHIINLGHVETMIQLQNGLDLRRPADPNAPDPLRSLRQTYAAAMKASPLKPKFIPTSWLTDRIPQGLDPIPSNQGQALTNMWIENAIRANKYDATGLNKTDPDDINYLRQALARDPITGAPSAIYTNLMSTPEGVEAITRLRSSIKRNFKDEQLFRDIGNRLEPIRALGDLLEMDPSELEPDRFRSP